MDVTILTHRNFESSENIYIPNPHWSPDQKQYFDDLAQSIDPNGEYILVATSGSSRTPKLVAIKKDAFISAAVSANFFLESSHKDIWLQTLPLFHVGGLSMCARAFASQATIIPFPKWNGMDFLKSISEHNITLTSLVPTQLFDVIQTGAKPPKSLRAVLIGGGSLSNRLAKEALSLGWPIIASFGMTETSALIAAKKLSVEILETAPLPSLSLSLLPHIQAKTDEQDGLWLKGIGLLCGYVQLKEHSTSAVLIDPKQDGWFLSEDRAHVTGNELTPLGRTTETVKINGELVDIGEIRLKVEPLLTAADFQSSIIIAVPHPRSEHEIVFMHENSVEDPSLLQEIYNAHLPRFAPIRRIVKVKQLPRSPLGKIVMNELKFFCEKT